MPDLTSVPPLSSEVNCAEAVLDPQDPWCALSHPDPIMFIIPDDPDASMEIC